MKKTFTKLFAALALLAFFIPSMIAVGQTTVTFTAGTDTGNGTVTKSGITIAMSSMNESVYKCYKSSNMSISSTAGNITNVTLTCTAEGQDKYGPGCFSLQNTQPGSYSYSSYTGTWTGSASSFSLYASLNQVRMSEIVVTIGGSAPTTYTVTYDANGGTGTMTDSNSPYTAGATVTVLDNDFTRSGYDFTGFNTAADGNGTAYDEGDTFEISANTTLYAQWSAQGSSSAAVTFDFTTNECWGLPTSKTVDENSYTCNGYTIKLAGSTGNGYSYNTTNNYLINGKSGAYLQFPAFSFDVEKIVVTGKSGASIQVEQNIYVGNAAVSTATTGATGTNTYIIADGYETAGTVYTLKVTSAHNTQITKIEIFEKVGGTPTVAAPVITPNGSSFLTTQEVSISCNTQGATIYYTTDGTTPSTSSTQYSAPFTLNATATVKAYAVLTNYTDSQVTEATFTKITPMTVAEAITAIDNASNNQVSGAYVAGIISQVDSYDSEHNSITYWISDDGTTTTQLEVYSGKGLNGASFNGISDLGVGDQVVVYGDLKIYNNVYEFNYNNYLVSYTAHQAQTYDLTVNALTNVEMFVFDANDQSQSLIEGGATAQTAQVLDGTSILVSVSATQGYGLATFTVDGVDHLADINSSDEYTFTMPGHDVTITATAQPVYTISFYVNGTIDSTLEKTIPQSNNATLGDLPTPAAASVPAGFQFYGWMVKPANVYYNATTAPTMVNASTTVSGNMNLAAVFAQTDNSNLTIGELTSTEIAGEFANGNHAYADDEVEYVDGDFTWAAMYSSNNGRHWMQLKKDDNVYIKIVAPSSIQNVEVVISNASNQSGGIDEITMHGAYDATGYIYLNTTEGGTHVGTTSGLDVVNNNATIIPSGDNTTLYLQVDKAARIWGVTVSCGQVTYINYTTMVVTFQTDIAQYTSGENDGWYLIASPVMENITPVAGNGFITSAYDLYRFNPTAEKEWENWKSNENESSHYHFSIETGRGYLYASSSNTTLEFTGTLNTDSDVTLTYDGWNLIGNSSNATRYVSGDYYIINSTNSGIIVSERTGGYVNAMEGILVNGSASGVITFSTSAKASRSNSKVVLNVVNNNGNVIDRAIARFDESDNFEKITLAQNDTKIYFPMADADYAIVSSDGHGTMPVNFKAKEMGRYTISVETEGIDLSYLHLIDRLTGENIDLLLDSKYSFIASNNDNEERFILSFTEKGYDAHGNEIFVYQSGNDLIVNGEGELQIFDVMGRMVKNTTINGVEAIAMPQGVYIFKLNGNVQKIVVR